MLKPLRISQLNKTITSAEKKHLAKTGCKTLAQFERNAAAQKEMRRRDPRPEVEPCWVCRHVAQKLGLEV